MPIPHYITLIGGLMDMPMDIIEQIYFACLRHKVMMIQTHISFMWIHVTNTVYNI